MMPEHLSNSNQILSLLITDHCINDAATQNLSEIDKLHLKAMIAAHA